MGRVDEIKARLNQLVDISESGQMNREVIARFLTEGPEDIFYLLSLSERYKQALLAIQNLDPVDADHRIAIAQAALKEE